MSVFERTTILLFEALLGGRDVVFDRIKKESDAEWTNFNARATALHDDIAKLLADPNLSKEGTAVDTLLILSRISSKFTLRSSWHEPTLAECKNIVKYLESNPPVAGIAICLARAKKIGDKFSAFKTRNGENWATITFLLGICLPLIVLGIIAFIVGNSQVALNSFHDNFEIFFKELYLSPSYLVAYAILGFSGGFLSVALRVTATRDISQLARPLLVILALIRAIFGAMAAVIVVMMFQADIFPQFISPKASDDSNVKTLVFLLTVSFVAGFSERLFSQGVAKIEGGGK